MAAKKVNVFRQLGATGGPIPLGGVEKWAVTFGGGDDNYGRSLWFEAHPLAGRPGSKSLEVRAKRINESGGRRDFSVEVVNTGAGTAMYGLFLFWTDKP